VQASSPHSLILFNKLTTSQKEKKKNQKEKKISNIAFISCYLLLKTYTNLKRVQAPAN
jgi:hypothetical protein